MAVKYYYKHMISVLDQVTAVRNWENLMVGKGIRFRLSITSHIIVKVLAIQSIIFHLRNNRSSTCWRGGEQFMNSLGGIKSKYFEIHTYSRFYFL